MKIVLYTLYTMDSKLWFHIAAIFLMVTLTKSEDMIFKQGPHYHHVECSPQEWKCTGRFPACIKKEEVCNKVYNCLDRSDEDWSQFGICGDPNKPDELVDIDAVLRLVLIISSSFALITSITLKCEQWNRGRTL
eukprot:GFUD01012668.1.p1 GENE.GFUD01012668.1~~GFUD01012668.1.p1  ORF type:complete len:134 (+),score=15.68 GFUD01012668.1:163-564(+)